LPLAQPDRADDTLVPEGVPPITGRALRLLVAEDHPINQKLMSSVLSKLGHACVLAEHGRKALEIYRQDPDFDLVLMDMQMPEMDGLQATRAMRSLEAERGWSRVPIAAMTANVLDSDRQACSLAGMDHHLAKPLRIAELEPLLQSWARPTGGVSRSG
jgi:CheY-like chemotaxis protein